VEETIETVLAEVLAEAPVVSEKNGVEGAEPLKKKATPKKKAEAPVVVEAVVEEPVAPVKKKATPKKKAEAPVVVKEPSPEPELEEEELTNEADAHEEVTYEGVEYYLKLDDQTVYVKATQEYAGKWNAEEQSVEFDEEEEEEE
jgi:cell pole-organizing protein PopZ